VGTAPHLTGELFKQLAGIEMTHVPYRGDAPALTDTIAGRINLQIGGSAMIEQIKSGQVRGLAVTTAKRSQLVPELPSVAEAAVPGFDVMGWFAFFAPRKTSRAIMTKFTSIRSPPSAIRPSRQTSITSAWWLSARRQKS